MAPRARKAKAPNLRRRIAVVAILSVIVLVVTGGSSGAQRINEAFQGAAAACQAAGVQVLHITGAGKGEALREATAELPDYHVVDYV
ncbi:UDP-N-acetylglucosamine--N-acetylmuramyl-(pentapeptide) pyrophosphoryl-undecaprenol N-acetylglucosamine transferase, partial [Geobacillus sp. MMMUD3]|nr:UDP-N-acetylglucosamine--N-acetylmuramyl-(pentapeptide) pyrophosphoryl-undecaprenol N-acetylglucosamine transferase [Geobacillus sp. MMMUD3]